MNYPETNETPGGQPEVSNQSNGEAGLINSNNTILSNQQFLSAIFGPFGWQNSHVTAFGCPPDQSTVVSWAGGYAKASTVLENAALNQYFTVSLFNPDGSNKSRRRKDDFKEQCCTVLDDLGSGIGAKIDPLVANDKPPFSWMLETSPGNYQCGYLFRDPVSDADLLSRFNDAMIYQGMCSDKDPGQRGTTRYMRLPNGINNKSKYGEPFQCKLVTWNPEIQYTVEELIQGWGLVLSEPGSTQATRTDYIPGTDELENILVAAGLFGPDQGDGYLQCPCPNEASHTIDDGRSGYKPGTGFKCFHGKCDAIGSRELMDWLQENHSDEVALEWFGHPQMLPEEVQHVTGPEPPMGSQPAKIFTLENLTCLSTRGRTAMMKENLQNECYIFPGIALSGQMTMIYAKANAGKTLLFLSFIISAIKSGTIRGEDVFYINADDNYKGLYTKSLIAEQFGFYMISPQEANTTTKEIITMLDSLAASGEMVGKIVIMDTLKKFTDMMNKNAQASLYEVLRKLVTKGATVIIAGHANKHLDADGKLVYEGTSDTMNDIDCMYSLYKLSEPEEPLQAVEFRMEKSRGDNTAKVAYSYRKREGMGYLEIVESVSVVSEHNAAVAARNHTIRELVKEYEAEVIAISYVLGDESKNHTELMDGVKNMDTNATVRKTRTALSLLAGSLWETSQGENNATIYRKIRNYENYLSGQGGV